MNFALGECGMELSTNEKNEIIYTMRVEMVEFDDYGHDSYILDVAVNVECRYQPTVGVASKRKHSSVRVKLKARDSRNDFQIIWKFDENLPCEKFGRKVVKLI